MDQFQSIGFIGSGNMPDALFVLKDLCMVAVKHSEELTSKEN